MNRNPIKLLIALQTGALTGLLATAAHGGALNVIPWGDTNIAAIPPDFTNVVAIALGEQMGVGLKSDGTAESWGTSEYLSLMPTVVSNVVQISEEGAHALFLLNDGTVVSGGYDAYGQSDVPPNLGPALAVACGGLHSLALLTNGTVVGWGEGEWGETTTPPGLSNVVAITGMGYASAALKSDGTVVAWGDDSYGETGVPSNLSNVVAISGGMYHFLALQSNGQVFSIPGGTLGWLSNVVAIAAGDHHDVVLMQNGTVLAWGEDLDGETNVPVLPSNLDGVAAGGYCSAALIGGDPFITKQPIGATTFSGWTITMSTAALGRSPVSFVWQHNGIDLSGATNAVLTLSNIQVVAGGTYSVRAVDAAGTNYSLNVPVVVSNAAPIFTVLSPLYQMVGIGSNASFSATLTGSSPVSYQWQFDGTNIDRATNSSLTLSNLQWGDDGPYGLVASNAYGLGVSSNLILALMDLPTALNATNYAWTTSGSALWNWETNTTHDGIAAAQSGSINLNQQSVLQTTFTGPGALTFWWTVSCDPTWSSLSVSVNGVTKSSISGGPGWLQQTLYLGDGVQNVAWVESRSITGGNGIETGWLDQVSFVNGPTPPFVTVPPTNETVNAGNSATFAVTAQGTPPLAYSWQLNGTNITGATNSTLTLTDVQAPTAGVVTAVISNEDGTITTNANLIVNPSGPLIVTEPRPASLQVLTGSSLNLSVAAKGSEPLSYQWSFAGTPLASAVNAQLSLSNMQPTNSGTYQVTITNAYGSTNSTTVNVAVVPAMVVGWGNNGSGQTNVPFDLTNAVAVSSKASQCLALRSSGMARLWGLPETVIPAGISNLAAIAQGAEHSLALRDDGRVMAWGINTSGETNVPTNLSNVVAISAGNEFSVALKADGTISAWGNNAYHQTNIPAGLSNVVGIATGMEHILALTAGGSVVAWGLNSSGQTNVPPGLSNVVAVAAGDTHSMALRSDGTVVIWGNNTYGQTNVPATASNVVAMAGGGSHSVVLRSDGRVIAWGLSNYGQTNVPTVVGNAIGIAAGEYHTLALINNGAPGIIRQSFNQSILAGGNLGLTVTAIGNSPLSYQWLFNGAAIDGQTNAVLVLTDPGTTNAGSYQCVVSNSLGTVTSQEINLSVARTTPFFSTSPSALMLTDEGFAMQLNGLSGHGPVVVYASTNLTDWLPVVTNPPAVGAVQLLDSSATNSSVQFYRAVEE